MAGGFFQRNLDCLRYTIAATESGGENARRHHRTWKEKVGWANWQTILNELELLSEAEAQRLVD
jgi:hypothetical protein